MLQTGQIEAKYQVSRDTLRFYIEEGLVVPDKVAGKYQWLPEHEAALTNILELRALAGEFGGCGGRASRFRPPTS